MTTYAGTGAIFQANASATSGNLGGGGFNPSNAHFPTDGVIAGGTGNAATITPTSSYAFAAGDNTSGVMVFFPVQSGVTYPSWFPITGVSGGAATLNTSIGAGIQIINNRMVPNATAGCASSATPTLTYGIDYSRMTSARTTASTASGTTTAFADTGVGSNWIGNFICISTGTGATAGWYEATNVAATTATLDRTAGTSYSVTTYYMGGAVSLGGSTTGITDAIFFALGSTGTTSGCRTFIKKGTYALSGAITTTVNSNGTWPFIYEGYNSVNGDRPSIGSGNQPVFAQSTGFGIADYCQLWCCSLKISGSNSVTLGSSAGYSLAINCKVIVTNTGASQALNISKIGCIAIACEVVCYAGSAISTPGSATGNNGAIGCYLHDSNDLVLTNNVGVFLINNLFVSPKRYHINNGAVNGILTYGNTFYGTEAQSAASGFNQLTMSVTLNNIFYGLTNAFTGSETAHIGYSDFNCLYNNTLNISASDTGAFLGANDLTATNPSFTNISQVTGSTATSSGTTLTDSGKNFTTAGVIAGQDYLHVISGTGATLGIYGITVVGTTTITTDNTIGTSSGGNLVYYITINRNLLPTGAV